MAYSAELPRSRMLKVRADISRGIRFGDKFPGENLTLIIVGPGVIRKKPGEECKQYKTGKTLPEMAVLVSKKCGRSYRRIRLKRLVREFFRLNQELFQGCDAVIFSLHKSVEDEKEFKEELKRLSETASKTINT